MRCKATLLAAVTAAVALVSASAAQAAVVTDTFTGTNGALLESHTGEVGATWNWHPNYPADLKLQNNKVWGPEWGLYFASGVPATNEYDVTADLTVMSNAGAIGVTGRTSTSVNDDLYMARYNAGSARWELVKCSGTCTNLGFFYQTLAIGSTYAVKLEIRNATKKLYVDGVERVSSTDNTITQVGRAGIRSGPGVTTASTGYHLDNFNVNPPPSTDTQISAGPSGPTNNASPSFSFNSVPGGGTFECMLRTNGVDGAWGSCTSPKAYSSLANGTYRFNVRATVGGVVDPTPATRDFVVDTVAPTATIDSGPTGTITTNSATFGFSSETGATFQCALDGPTPSSYASCTSTRTYSSLSNGSYTFKVKATDTAGNVSSEVTRGFTVSVSSLPTYTVQFQDSFEGSTFPEVFGTGAWNAAALLDGTGAFANQVTPSGYSAYQGTKVAEIGLTDTSTRAEIQCHKDTTPNRCAGPNGGSEMFYEWSFRVPSGQALPDGVLNSSEIHQTRPNLTQTKPVGADCYGGGMVIHPATNGNSSQFQLYQNIRGGSYTSGSGCTVPNQLFYNLGSFTKDTWHRVLMHVNWSTSATGGFMEMWIDGTQVMPLQTRATLLNGATKQMFRIGLYNSENTESSSKPGDDAWTWKVQYDDVKIGIP